MADQIPGMSEQDSKRLQSEYSKRITKSMTKTMSDALDKLLKDQNIQKKLNNKGVDTSKPKTLTPSDVESNIDDMWKKHQEDFNKNITFKSLFNPKNYKLAWDELRSTENRSVVGKLSKRMFGNSDDQFYSKKIEPRLDQAASLSKEAADVVENPIKDIAQSVQPTLDTRSSIDAQKLELLTRNSVQIVKSLDAHYVKQLENQKLFNQIVDFLNPSNNKDRYSLSEDFVETKAINEQSLKTLRDIRDHIITLDENVARLIKKDKGLDDLTNLLTGAPSKNEESFDLSDLASVIDIMGNRTRRTSKRGKSKGIKKVMTPVLNNPKPSKKLPSKNNSGKIKSVPNKTSTAIAQPSNVKDKLTSKAANEAKIEQPKKLLVQSANEAKIEQPSNKLPTKATNEVKLDQPKPVEPKALSTENKIVEPKTTPNAKSVGKVASKGVGIAKNVARKAGVIGGLAVSAYELYDMNNTLDHYNAEIDAKVKSGEMTAEQAEKEKSDFKKKTVSTSVGSSAGALIGGAIGMLAGPLGSMAGAAVGQWLGEKGGELIGNWLSSSDAKPAESAPSIDQPPQTQLNQRDLKIPNNDTHLKEQADYIDELKSQLDIKRANNNGSGGTVNVMNQNNNTNNRFDSSSWSPLSANHDSYHYYNQDNRKV